jgi:hypothetical protein
MGLPSSGKPSGIAYRSVGYDVGTTFTTGQGVLSRNFWNSNVIAAEVGLISGELHGNAVNLYGSHLGRLTEAAVAAVDRGLHVWLEPRLPDGSPDDVIEHMTETARVAESLRAPGAGIDLSLGAVHTFFTPGIFPGGPPYIERIGKIYFDGDHHGGVPGQWPTRAVAAELSASTPRLNEFLGRAATAARRIFNGRLAYNAAPWEEVDWRPFDVVGIQYLMLPLYLTPEDHLRELARYRQHGKPVFITGFGTASYQGAERRGFYAFDIVRRDQQPATIMDGYTRDEAAQAAYYRKMLAIFQQAGMDGVAPIDLIHPTFPHTADPRLDLDMASACIVKSIRSDFTDPDSAYHRELKQSFHAVADYYARLGADAAAAL